MVSRFLVATALVAWIGGLTLSVEAIADELDFIYVDRLPTVHGDRVRQRSSFDAGRGISFRQTVHEERLDAVIVVSIAVELFCGTEVPQSDTPPTIVAIRHAPIAPKSFAVATLHDVYSHAYARDRDGRIRSYINLHASEMEQLTDAVTPPCHQM